MNEVINIVEEPTGNYLSNGLKDLGFYQRSVSLYESCWKDCDVLMKDVRGKEIARQLIRSMGSVSANIEEGYGRGYGKSYPMFLKIARGSAQESKGWYKRSKFLLSEELIQDRQEQIEKIIAMITKTIVTLGSRKK